MPGSNEEYMRMQEVAALRNQLAEKPSGFQADLAAGLATITANIKRREAENLAAELDAARQSGVREGMERAAKLVCRRCGDKTGQEGYAINLPGEKVWRHRVPTGASEMLVECAASAIWAALAEEGRPNG